MPFWGQEGHVLDCWRASSSTEKGVSLKKEERGRWNILTVTIFLNSVSSLTEDNSFFHGGHFFFSQRAVLFLTEGSFFSHRTHRRTEHTKSHRDIKSTDFTERYSHRSLTQHPSLANHQHLTTNTQHPSLANHQHLTPITQHPSLAITLCDICMPEAFCGFEMCAKMLC